MNNNRLAQQELRSIKGFETVTDQEAELIMNDVLAFARMCLEVVNRK